MTNEEVFLSEGAEYFGNRLIHRNQDVGVKEIGGELVLNEYGQKKVVELADITDVEVKAPKSKAKKKVEDASPSDLDELMKDDSTV